MSPGAFLLCEGFTFNVMIGWIKLHRKFIEWEWFTVGEMVKLFIFLILSANNKDGSFQGYEVKRGQLITGINSLSHKTKLSVQTLRTCLKKLEKTGEINIQTTNKFSIITICKYNDYQPEEKLTNKQLTNEQQTTNKQLTTNKNDKNNKEYIYNEFYDSEIEKSNNDTSYKLFVDTLFGRVNSEPVYEFSLKLKHQISYDRFKSLLQVSKDTNKPLLSTLRAFENKKGKYTSLYLSLNTWLKNDFKK